MITPDRIVMELHKQRAPEQVVSEFFTLVDTTEKQLDLAKKLAWHRAVIDVSPLLLYIFSFCDYRFFFQTLVNMKDRQGLVLYQAALNPQSNDYLHAETALRINVKWKN